jgi:hypothetical protein
MSIILAPDPFPGRCKNHRTITHADGYSEALRCIDYEAEPHQCEFPPAAHRLTPSGYGIGTSQGIYAPTPVPWKKPDRNDRIESAMRPVSFDSEAS